MFHGRIFGCALLLAVALLTVGASAAQAAPGSLQFLEQHTEVGLGFARGVTVSPDGKNVYAAGQNADAIVSYSRNAATGALTSMGCIEDAGAPTTGCASSAEGLDSARFVAVTPDLKNVYVTGGDDAAVVVFDRNLSTGALSNARCFEGNDGPDLGATCPDLATPLLGAEGIAVSTDNNQVYVAAQGPDSLATLTRTPADGNLSFLEADTTGLDPRELAVSPDGKGVYVAAATSNRIDAFVRNPGTGSLSSAGNATGVSLPVGVAVSPDNQNVYAGAVNSSAVRTFTRNTTTSALTAAGCLKDVASATAGCSNAEGLGGVEGVAVSPDGQNVYAAGVGDDAVVAMTRTGGVLGPLGCLRDAQNLASGCGAGGSGLNSAHGVAVSPDNKNVYVTGQDDNALTVFSGVPAGGGGGPTPPPPPTPDPPPTDPACINPATLLVTCANPNGQPGVCGPSSTILPQCSIPTILPTVCGPSNTVLVACAGQGPYIAACGGFGTILPPCTNPPPQLPQVCGPSTGTILPPCTGGNNPVTVCGPSNTVLPQCNFGGPVDATPLNLTDGAGQIGVNVGCPASLARLSVSARAAAPKPDCSLAVVVQALREAETDTITRLASAYSYEYEARAVSVRGDTPYQEALTVGEHNSQVFRTRTSKITQRFLGVALPVAVQRDPVPFDVESELLRGSGPPDYFGRVGAFAAEQGLALAPVAPSRYSTALRDGVREVNKVIQAGTKKLGGGAPAGAAALRRTAVVKRFRIPRSTRRKRLKVKLTRRQVAALGAYAGRRGRRLPVRLVIVYTAKPRPVVRFYDLRLKVTRPTRKPVRKRR